jgi:hypothetical protein
MLTLMLMLLSMPMLILISSLCASPCPNSSPEFLSALKADSHRTMVVFVIFSPIAAHHSDGQHGLLYAKFWIARAWR